MPLVLQPLHPAEADAPATAAEPPEPAAASPRPRLSLLVLAIGVLASLLLAAQSRALVEREHREREHRAESLVTTALQVKLADVHGLLRALQGWLEVRGGVAPPQTVANFLQTLQTDGRSMEGIQSVGLAVPRAGVRGGPLEIVAVAPSTLTNDLLLHQDLRRLAAPFPLRLDPVSPGGALLTPVYTGSGRAAARDLLLALPVNPDRDGNGNRQRAWVFAQLPIQEFVRASLNSPLIHLDQPVDLRLYEGESPDPARLIYDSRNRPEGPALPDPQRRLVEAGGRRWLLLVQLPHGRAGLMGEPWLWGLLFSLLASSGLALAVHWLEKRHSRIEAALRRGQAAERDREEAIERLQLSAEAFSLIEEGVVITDRQGTILTCNDAYARISGYSRVELEGQNPRILQSGYHDEAFYRQMWRTLESSGHWQGEIWNRRRNGEIYPQWMQMRVIRAAAGGVSHYLATVSDLSRMREKEKQLEYLGYHDSLTELPNLRLAQLRLTQACYAHQPLAIVWIDLDGIKRINDSFGHAQGDQVLKALVDRFAPVLGQDDLLARIGGDEFLVLCPIGRGDVAPEGFARRLLDQLRTPVQVATGLELELTACAGISLYPEHSRDPDTLLQDAATALGAAKNVGPQTIRVYDATMTVSNRRRLAIESQLQRALEKGELQLHYQPQVDAQGRILGAEALVRWNSPELGPVSPGEFIPIAEASGLIHRLGEWVLLEACSQWQQWVQEGLAPARLAVNLSNQQFLDPRQSVADLVVGALAASGLVSDRLELEITESSLVPSLGAREQLEELARLGIRLAVDDFGTGFSSLSMLKSFPVAKLKIDRSFVAGLDGSEASRSIVRATLAMAAGLGLATLAEGVERQEELELLVRYGCGSFQGYLFGNPMPAVAFAEHLRSRRTRVAAGS